jgi:hypothetical protein
MADPFATHTDVEARWRPLSDAEDAVADQLATDASDMIRERWPDIDQRVTSGAIAAETLTRIVAQMVKRAMLNGDSEGLESRAQAAGPFSVSDKFANPNGNLYLTTADITLLDGLGWTSRSRVGWLG